MRQLVITNSITRRDSKSIEKYMNEVSRYELLSPEQEVRLFKQFKAGDEAALRQIITANLRFVISVAKQYQNLGLTLEDLINEGNLGLIKAAKRFDETKGFKFISYAVWWIRQSILQAVGEKARKIRVPINYQSTMIKVLEARDKLLQSFEREPNIAEIAKQADLSEDIVEKCLETNMKVRSLDAPMEEGEEATLKHFMADDKIPNPDTKVAHFESMKKEVQMLLNSLKPREAMVLSMYFGIDRDRSMSLGEIGDILGIGRERVRQIRDKSLRRLNSHIRREGLNIQLN
jgi:RNA polymerase primary sigma factor